MHGRDPSSLSQQLSRPSLSPMLEDCDAEVSGGKTGGKLGEVGGLQQPDPQAMIDDEMSK